jgi:hypothetical protein
MEEFGKICFAILVLFLLAISGGFVFMYLWDWFIVTAFQVQHLTLIECIGVSFFIGYNKGKTNTKENQLKDLGKDFIESLIYSGIILFLGYVIHIFY